VEPKNPEWTSAANGFSHDNSQAIYTSRELVTQFLPFTNGQDPSEPYLQMEGAVVHYDSQYGKLLRVHADGLYYRDLRRASRKLSEIGLDWEGPDFKESPPLPLDKVELSEELANIQGYSQWMDYLDDTALRDAQLHANDGHFAFQAAMVYVERCEYEQALALLQRSSELLPQALTPIQWQAYVFALMRRWPEAVAAATRFINATGDPDLLLQRAEWYLEMKEPKMALEDADEVIEQNKLPIDRAQAIKLLAYKQLGDVENVRATEGDIALNRSTDLTYSRLIRPMVMTELPLRHTRLAAVYASQIVDSTNPNYGSVLGWSSLREGDFEKALNTMKVTMQQQEYPAGSPDFARALALQVICHANLGDLELAQELLTQLKALRPASCTGEWIARAREIRLLTAEANSIVEQKSVATP
jgi:tetratricopeptide (TPR) repeat protein